MEYKKQFSGQGNINGQSKRKKKRWRIFFIVLGVLIVIRLILPYLVLDYVNKKLGALDQYYGRVNDIDLALIRGAYVIRDISIVKLNETHGDTIPFFASPEIDLSVQWKAIFKGAFVGEIFVEEPVLNFVKGKHKDEDLRADTADFKKLIRDLMPLTVNHFEIHNGEIHYLDNNVKPALDIALLELNAMASNLSNVNDSAKLLPAHLNATGQAYEGSFNLDVDFDALAKIPTFDLNAELKNLNLVLLNDMLRAYGNFDVKKGHFGLYTEFAAKEGTFGGYVKPILKDLDVAQWNKEEGNFKQILWETIVGGAAEIFQNQSEEQLASKIPIKGSFSKPQTNIWDAVAYVLRNAFVSALRPSIDRSINIRQLDDDKEKTFLQKIFQKEDRNKKNKKATQTKQEK